MRQAILLAAGLGTRLRPFTERVPKPLLPVLGVPVAQFALDQLSAAGAKALVVNLHHLPDVCRSGFEAMDRSFALGFSLEADRILGSAGGLRQAMTYLPEPDAPFYWLNGDVLADVDLVTLYRRHQNLRARWGVSITLALHPGLDLPGSYVEVLYDAEADRVRGLGGVTRGRPVFTGTAVVEPDFLADVRVGEPADITPDRLKRAAAQGKVGAYMLKPQALWCDIGEPKVWFDTHLELMRRMERGDLSPRIRKRIESVSKRITEGIWARESCASLARKCELAAPAYFAGASGVAHVSVGPRAVIYGAIPETRAYQNEIVFNGASVRV